MNSPAITMGALPVCGWAPGPPMARRVTSTDADPAIAAPLLMVTGPAARGLVSCGATARVGVPNRSYRPAAAIALPAVGIFTDPLGNRDTGLAQFACQP